MTASKISKSPERHTFQKEGYAKRMEEKNEPVNEDYLDMFEKILNEHKHKFDDPESRVNNMEYDLLTTDWILEKVRASETYAQNLYAAMCNNGFIKLDIIPILKQEEWGASWRYAGGIIADMRQEGDYIDWYCSGIRGGMSYNEELKDNLVPEGCITDEIRADLQQLGWAIAPGGDWEDFINGEKVK
jgi:hypothetical protein